MLPQILPFVMLFGGAGKGVLGNLEFNLGLIYGCGGVCRSVMWRFEAALKSACGGGHQYYGS